MKQRNQPLIIIVNGTQAFKINDPQHKVLILGIFIFMLKLLKNCKHQIYQKSEEKWKLREFHNDTWNYVDLEITGCSTGHETGQLVNSLECLLP